MRYILFLFCFVAVTLYGQYTQPDDGLLFVDNEVPRIDVYVDSDSLELLFDDLFSNHEFPATFVFTSSGLIDTVYNVGFRLRGNTSRTADKKSFKISFNTFESGRKFQGVEKLNLNGEHNDPSIVRSKLAWDLCKWNDIPAARANHVAFYINDEYAGLYVNVEHIDEEFVQKRMSDGSGNLFKCLYPADLHYKGPNANAYKEVIFGRRAYELKTNTDADDYTKLAEFIAILNNTPFADFECELENIFDVDTYLKMIAVDILTANWDGPIVNKNNFYLYFDTCEERFTYLPFDLDNTFGIDWFEVDWANTDIYNWSQYSGQYRPIYEKIMAVDEYRDRYTYYLKEILDDYFNNEFLDVYLDDKLELIKDYRVNDQFAELDYNWTYQDFLDSYDTVLGAHVKNGMKDFIAIRAASANNQLNENDIYPVIRSIDENWNEFDVEILVDVEDDIDLGDVRLHFSFEDSEFVSVPMISNTSGKWSFTFEAEENGVLRYYITAEDNVGNIQRYPACDVEEVQMGYLEVPNIVINEFMASNTMSYADEYGEFDDWIEVYNLSDQTLPIYKYYLSDDASIPNKWKMPNTILPPNDYIVIWADGNPSQGSNHANFKLKKGGEFIGLYDDKENHFAPISTVAYDAQESDESYARLPNGIGDFEMTTNVTPGSNNDVSNTSENSDFRRFKFYPNPASDFLVLDKSGRENYVFQLLDVRGSIIYDDIESEFLDISNLSNGIYFIRTKNLDQELVQKFVILK